MRFQEAYNLYRESKYDEALSIYGSIGEAHGYHLVSANIWACANKIRWERITEAEHLLAILKNAIYTWKVNKTLPASRSVCIVFDKSKSIGHRKLLTQKETLQKNLNAINWSIRLCEIENTPISTQIPNISRKRTEERGCDSNISFTRAITDDNTGLCLRLQIQKWIDWIIAERPGILLIATMMEEEIPLIAAASILKVTIARCHINLSNLFKSMYPKEVPAVISGLDFSEYYKVELFCQSLSTGYLSAALIDNGSLDHITEVIACLSGEATNIDEFKLKIGRAHV